MKYSFNFCHGSRTVGFSTSTIFVEARPPPRLLCRWYIHILDLSSLRMANVRLSDTRRRTSNYGGGGIGARSVGTDRNDFSVTFWQRQANAYVENHFFVFSRKRGSARTFRCADTRRLRTILAAIVRSSAAGNRGTQPSGADLYEAGAPGWERGSLGSYRGALDLRWDRSAGYWICLGVGGPARSRRGQCWTAGRVCTLFSFRNDPPEESRSSCLARARGELGDGVCFRTCSRRVRVRATGVNEPPRFFWRAFPLRPETRFIRRALCGRGHLCRRDGGRRD